MNVCDTVCGRQRYDALDICKFVMAFVVIAIHTNPFVNCTNTEVIRVVITIEDLAVPFFFIASGFFLKVDKWKQYLKRICLMYFIVTALSFPLTMYGYIESGNGVAACILSYIKYFFFVGKLYNSYHLWYLLSLIYSVLLIALLHKTKKESWACPISIMLYFLYIIMQFLSQRIDVLPQIIKTAVSIYQYIFNNGGIFSGMLYVVIGMSIANKKVCINKYASIAGIIILYIMNNNTGSISTQIFTIFEATLFFMVVIDINIPKIRYGQILRKLSTNIYLVHLLCFSFYSFLIIHEPNKLGIDSFIVTSGMSFFIAFIMVVMENKYRRRLV